MPDKNDKTELRRNNAELKKRVSELEEIIRQHIPQESIQLSEEKYRLLADNSLDCIWKMDGNLRFTYVNRAVYSIFAFTPEEWVGSSLWDHCNKKEYRSMKKLLVDDLKNEKYQRTDQMMILHKDGRELPIETVSRILIDENKRFIGLQGSSRDITERNRMEEELRASEERYFNLFNNANDLIQIVGPTGKFLSVNKKWLATLEYTLEEAMELSISDILPDDKIAQTMERLKKVLDGETVNFETVFVSKSGREITVEGSGNDLFKNDTSVSAVGIFRDVSERVRAKNQVLELEKFNESIVNNLSEGIILENDEGILQFANPAMLRMLGYEEDELLGNKWDVFVPDDQIEIVGDANRRRNQGETNRYEMDLIKKNKERISVLVSGVPHYRNGIYTGLLAAFIDITEQTKLEAQLHQAQKMESIGRLAGGVAHDFNNMLGVILGHTEIALGQMDPADPLHTHLSEIRTAAERSADLTRQLLAFARKQTIAPRVLDLNRTVDGMLKMLQRLIGENIDLTFLPGTDLWHVNLDPVQINQVLVNLCVNARDSISSFGKITIETENANPDDAYCAGHPGFYPGEYVLMTISDTGCGMDSETKRNLFEPFFTTKEVGKGTGLGLSTIYGIVKQNNGFIDVYSEPGYGTIFKIYLPRLTASAAAEQKEVTVEPIKGGQETILLVEDEVSILQLIMMMLEHQGYTVMSASTPGEAISLAKAHPGEIDLLMTDVVMPEMNGGDLARNLLSFYPNLKRLFMSGYTANVIAHQGVLEEGVIFIQKPFRNKDLAVKVREALDS